MTQTRQPLKPRDARRNKSTDSSADDPLWQELQQGLLQNSKRALAQAITLSESQHAHHRACARSLLRALQKRTLSTSAPTSTPTPKLGLTRRIGITGAPGAGKSTLIAALCQCLLRRRQKEKIAVLASDPSSVSGGGAVLADKTRMGALVGEPRVFVRPSPASAEHSLTTGLLENLLLCEACGYETLLVESVGSGQAETLIDDYVDCLLVLVAPGSGDGLQGMKRGLLELADILVVTKADGEQARQAHKTLEDYRQALGSSSTRRTTRYLVCSAEGGKGEGEKGEKGVDSLCEEIDAFFAKRSAEEVWKRRCMQRKNLFLRAFAKEAVEDALRRGKREGGETLSEVLERLNDTKGEGLLPAEEAAKWFAKQTCYASENNVT